MKKKLPRGIEFFDKLIERDCYYVDKTLLIKELLDSGDDVTLITRPRRFGKTLAMSMLSCFFDINRDGKALFSDLSIMEHEDIVARHMNKYPVIFLSLKDVVRETYENSLEKLAHIISFLYQNNAYLLESGKLSKAQSLLFRRYCEVEATSVELELSLLHLSRMLRSFHKKRVIILIDEYDAPIDNAETEGFYDKMIKFMRGFLGSALKTNHAMEFAVITGVQRIAQEGLFSKLNNARVVGVVHEAFSDCFGFTEEEVAAMCQHFDAPDSMPSIKAFYDGYRIGNKDIYNPWSIIAYLQERKLELYWVNTSSLTVLQNIFVQGNRDLKEKAEGLLLGTPVTMTLDDHITYPIDYSASNLFWTMLLNAGYIKHVSGTPNNAHAFQAELVNTEVKVAFRVGIENWLRSRKGELFDGLTAFLKALQTGDAVGMQKALNDKLLLSPSYHDMICENSYHMFILGMLQSLQNDYVIRSNREEGKGRADCTLRPADMTKPALVIEFKHLKKDGKDDTDASVEQVKAAAADALRQISTKSYAAELSAEGYGTIFEYGIAFNGKYCEVMYTV